MLIDCRSPGNFLLCLNYYVQPLIEGCPDWPFSALPSVLELVKPLEHLGPWQSDVFVNLLKEGKHLRNFYRWVEQIVSFSPALVSFWSAKISKTGHDCHYVRARTWLPALFSIDSLAQISPPPLPPPPPGMYCLWPECPWGLVSITTLLTHVVFIGEHSVSV